MANKQQDSGFGLGTGIGMAAIAAAAAGAYYFYHGKDGEKRRKQLKSWAVKAKGEMMEKMEKMKEVSQQAYDGAVKDVMAKYKKMKNIDPKELADLGLELKSYWDRISRQLKTQPAAKRKAPAKGKAKAKS